MVQRGAAQGHDARHVAAIARGPAVKHFDQQRRTLVVPLGQRRAEVVHRTQEQRRLQVVVDDRAVAHAAVQRGDRNTTQQAPVLQDAVTAVQAKRDIHAAAGRIRRALFGSLILAHAVVIIVELGIAPRHADVRAQGPAVAAPVVGIAKAQFAAMVHATHVMHGRGTQRAPCL